MSRRPLSPEVWEQALVNGRRIHPSDSAVATAWSEQWYRDQGGRFSDDLEPTENTMSDEAFMALVAQSDHGLGPFEPEAKSTEQEEALIPMDQPIEPAQPQVEEPKRPHRRVRRQG